MYSALGRMKAFYTYMKIEDEGSLENATSLQEFFFFEKKKVAFVESSGCAWARARAPARARACARAFFCRKIV